MKRAIAGSVLLIGSILFAGCGFVFVARSQPYAYHSSTPAYCYDCHHWAPGVVYSRCSRYEIREAHGGYYYRPYAHGRHQEYRFAKFNGSDRNRDYRTERNNSSKSTRGRR